MRWRGPRRLRENEDVRPGDYILIDPATHDKLAYRRRPEALAEAGRRADVVVYRAEKLNGDGTWRTQVVHIQSSVT